MGKCYRCVTVCSATATVTGSTELGESYSTLVPNGTEQQLQRGATLFGQLCAACHGGRGKADGHAAVAFSHRPSDLTDPDEAAFFSEQARLHVIKKGIAGGTL